MSKISDRYDDLFTNEERLRISDEEIKERYVAIYKCGNDELQDIHKFIEFRNGKLTLGELAVYLHHANSPLSDDIKCAVSWARSLNNKLMNDDLYEGSKSRRIDRIGEPNTTEGNEYLLAVGDSDVLITQCITDEYRVDEFIYEPMGYKDTKEVPVKIVNAVLSHCGDQKHIWISRHNLLEMSYIFDRKKYKEKLIYSLKRMKYGTAESSIPVFSDIQQGQGANRGSLYFELSDGFYNLKKSKFIRTTKRIDQTLYRTHAYFKAIPTFTKKQSKQQQRFDEER